jgi:hypothetical protein
MPMTKDDLGREYFIDVTKDGACFVRQRGTGPCPHGGLPVYSTTTKEEAKNIIVRLCRLERDGSGIYRLNNPPSSVDDLGHVSDLFRASHATIIPRFRVNDEPVVTLPHLISVNPELTEEDLEIIRAMKPGDTQVFGHGTLKRVA